MAVDWSDPCERAKALEKAYYELTSGQTLAEVEYRSNNTTRRRVFSRVDITRLEAEFRTAQAECQAKTNPTAAPLRRGLRAGFVRRCY